MIKQVTLFIVLGTGMLNFCGCLALWAGGAAVVGGAGTAVWMSGKLTQQVNAPYQKTVDASVAALHSLNFPVLQETQTPNTTQIKSTYSDGRDIWVDVDRVNDSSTKVAVRVGAVTPDKDAASMVLNKIQSSL